MTSGIKTVLLKTLNTWKEMVYNGFTAGNRSDFDSKIISRYFTNTTGATA
jgi:hypothetical protein